MVSSLGRNIAIIVSALALSTQAAAFEPRILIDFNLDSTTHEQAQRRADPVQYTMLRADICSYTDTYYPDQEMKSLHFRIDVPFNVSAYTTVEPLIEGSEVTETSPNNYCIDFDDCFSHNGYSHLARIEMFYLRGSGRVTIDKHVPEGRTYRDCDYTPTSNTDHTHLYCVYGDGGIHQNPSEPNPNCWLPTPVEDISWGTIKAIYR